MSYEAKKYDHLLGTPGFSDALLKNHFTLYEGYVKNTNTLLELLKKMLDEGWHTSPGFAEAKRRFGWEFNGMRLHELYFENMNKEGSAQNTERSLHELIVKQFGSYENWEKDFKATGAMRGIGWAMLNYDKETGMLFNVWANEHDVGHLAGTKILMIMDVFEHAFMLDYGLKRADYIETFFKAIDWDIVEKRFSAAK